METDFKACFLLVETIVEIRQNPIFKTYFCWGKLFLLGETDFRLTIFGNHFFRHFSETPTADSVFSSSRKVFFNEIFQSV